MLLATNVLAEDQSAALTTAVQTDGKTPARESATKTLVWPDGTRYVGGVVDGKRSGKGTIFWQDGTRFVGMFDNDMRNGSGTMILPDGTVYTGFFKDDELVDSPGASAITAAGTDEPDMTPKKTEPASNAIAKGADAANPAQTETVDTTKAGTVITKPIVTKPVVTKPAVTESTVTESSTPASAAAKAVPSTPGESTPNQSVKEQFSQQVSRLTDEVKAQLIDTIDLWGAAWSDQNVPQYLSNYSEDFKVPGKQSRRSWEGLRRSRLNRPRSIDVGIVYEKFELLEPNLVNVFFKQTYRSEVYRDVTDKVLQMRKEGQEWKIMVERSQ